MSLSLPAYDEEARPRLLVDPGWGRVELRGELEGFRVDEIPLYEPEGEGEHLYLRIEKRGLSTPGLLRRVREVYGVKERDVGVAGRKDARGVTTQWLSAPARAVSDEGAGLEGEDCRVLQAGRHPRKLRLGFLRGNRFSVLLSGPASAGELDALRSRAAELEQRGGPNYFGAQRFGAGSGSLREAERFVARGKKARTRKERFLVSVVQSALFNRWLAERVADGLLHKALPGDVMQLEGSRSTFLSEDPEKDTARVAAADIAPAGPLFGAEMRSAVGDALTRESRSLSGLGVEPEELVAHPAFQVGDRRPALYRPEDIEVEPAEGGARLSFTLRRGTYATVMVEEIVGSGFADQAFALDA